MSTDNPDYRRRYLARIRGSEVEPAGRRDVSASLGEEFDAGTAAQSQPPSRRRRTRAKKRPADTLALIDLVANADEHDAARVDAMRVLQSRSFAVQQFQPYVTPYVNVLRTVAKDPRATVRAEALELLALRKDEYAQRLLVDGLEGAIKPLVTTRKAVRFLGYDPHATPREVLVRLSSQSKDVKVRHQALRLLAGDGRSLETFRRIASDQDEDAEARRIGLIALQSLDPTAFRSIARDLVRDESVDDQLRAASLAALAHDVRASHATVPGAAFGGAVQRVKDRTESRALRHAARQYLDATGQADD